MSGINPRPTNLFYLSQSTHSKNNMKKLLIITSLSLMAFAASLQAVITINVIGTTASGTPYLTAGGGAITRMNREYPTRMASDRARNKAKRFSTAGNP